MSKFLRDAVSFQNSVFGVRYSAVRHGRPFRFGRQFLAIGLFIFCTFARAASLPFPLNERLDYHISWNGILVAWSASTTAMVEENGTNYVSMKVETQTYPFFDMFYKVNDVHECLLDPETLKPTRFTMTMSEGSAHSKDLITFDYPNGLARIENLESGAVTNVAISPETRDYLSFMYFMRGQELQPGTTTKYNVLANNRVYEVLVHVEKIEKIGLSNYPDVLSLRIEPEAAFDGLFIRSGKATLWISRDLRRIMTCLKAWVPFGRVTVRLKEVSGAGDDFWITAKEGR